MWIVFGALLAGWLFGLIPGIQRWSQTNKILGTIGVFLLLASMGVELGSNEQVMASLGHIGLAATALSTAAILGSLACAALIIPILKQITVTDDSERSIDV